MKRAGWWLWAALLSTGAWAQPEIVDPTPDDGEETDWGLALAAVDLGGATLQNPSGLVMLGSRVFEELLVLEKHTGRVRHFAEGEELPVALNLGVDTCGERGAIDIALHPFFDRGSPTTSDPLEPRKDWIYVSYHTTLDPAAPDDDGCHGGAAQLRVERFTWNGTTLEDPVLVFHKDLAATETTELGGSISVGFATQPGDDFTIVGRLYVAIGALGRRNGQLQNTKASEGGGPLDDTSVVFRVDDRDGIERDEPAPNDNPFDSDDDQADPQDYYLAYGLRDPRAILVDPVTQIFDTRVWVTERSEGGKDEVDLLLFGKNSGFKKYQGFIASPARPYLAPPEPPNTPNPSYPLVDLARNATDELDVTTYGNPLFSFEDESVTLGPTGLAMGGTEVGILHREALFVGTEDGQLLRFRPNGATQLTTFLLIPPLGDFVANKEIPDDPATPPPQNEFKPADSLAQIVIADGFGRVSDLATGVDGSIYVLDGQTGTVHRVLSDSRRDLSVLSISAPKKIALSTKKPSVTKSVKVTLLNRGEVPERIFAEELDDDTTPDTNEAIDSLRSSLENLLGLTIAPTGGCAALGPPRVVVPKYALPPHSPAVGIAANGGKLTIEVQVDWTCEAPSPRGEPDFATSVDLDMRAIGIRELAEWQPNNACPRAPRADQDPDPNVVDPDPGCGARLPDKTLGGPVVTDVTKK
jgi:glucose/arabinose dehydrogenase